MARYNEGFYHFFLRELCDGPRNAWRAEARFLVRAGRRPWDHRNPSWRYAALQAANLVLALLLGGWTGLAVPVPDLRGGLAA